MLFSQKRPRSPSLLVVQGFLSLFALPYLGVVLDSRLSFVYHHKYIWWKATVQFNSLCAIFYTRTVEYKAKLLVFNAYVRSIRMYSCPIFIMSHFRNFCSLCNRFICTLSAQLYLVDNSIVRNLVEPKASERLFVI